MQVNTFKIPDTDPPTFEAVQDATTTDCQGLSESGVSFHGRQSGETMCEAAVRNAYKFGILTCPAVTDSGRIPWGSPTDSGGN